jgi:four helix bundle protein
MVYRQGSWYGRKKWKGAARMEEKRKPIRSFFDLEVYQNTYKASILVINEILPKLPQCEKYDLVDQLRRSSKAVPRLIAEGYSKRHQKAGFQKYLDDAMAESNETIVSLCHVRDLYSKYIQKSKVDELIKIYDISRYMILAAVNYILWPRNGEILKQIIELLASTSNIHTSIHTHRHVISSMVNRSRSWYGRKKWKGENGVKGKMKEEAKAEDVISQTIKFPVSTFNLYTSIHTHRHVL